MSVSDEDRKKHQDIVIAIVGAAADSSVGLLYMTEDGDEPEADREQWPMLCLKTEIEGQRAWIPVAQILDPADTYRDYSPVILDPPAPQLILPGG